LSDADRNTHTGQQLATEDEAMTTVVTTPLGPGHFGAEIREGAIVRHCEVVIDGNLLDDMALIDVDHRHVAEETIGFLLERRTAAALPDRISIRDVDRTEPDYRTELTARLASS
jgi:hypothetical protein